MAFSDQDIFDLIKKTQKEPEWVKEARDIQKELNALKYGVDYKELLVRIEHVENSDRAIARKKYSYDIRDMFERVMQPRQNVFNADGGSVWWKEGLNEKRKKNIHERLQDFKGRKSLEKYLSDSLFYVSDIDPNGLLFLEYKTQNNQVEDVYPTYKSIQDIQNYEPDGIKLKWVLFAPKQEKTPEGKEYKEWRFVDEARDVRVGQTQETMFIIKDKTFVNDFKEVPAVILSNIEKFGSKLRLSWLFFVVSLAKKYARDTSVKTIYEFLQAFPKHWRYAQVCNTCRGTGKKDGKTCPTCSGKGELGRNDVTDDIRIPLPKEGDPIVAPNFSGFNSPDLETLEWMETNRAGLEALIEKTMWGTHKEADQTGNETATGRFIDIQPVQNKLNVFADYTEQVHNLLAGYIITLVDPQSTDDPIYHKDYGRRFIIESPDVLNNQYLDAKEKGASYTILDRMLEEVIMSKYKNDPIMRNMMTKKARVEPYVHMGITTVYDTFGEREAKRKDVYPEWWRTEADKNKQEEQLREDFNNWFNLNYPDNGNSDGSGEPV